MQYLEEVLIPKVAENYGGITVKKACEIMLESVKFGEYVHEI